MTACFAAPRLARSTRRTPTRSARLRIPERTPEWLRRIHSLTGMIPLGVFLVEHLAVNAAALGGPTVYRRVVESIGSLPGTLAFEVLGIGLPLLIHIGIGILIATEIEAEGNPDARGWATWSQRLTGVYLMVYVVFHVWGTRLSPDALAGRSDLFTVMQREVRAAPGFVFHALGVLAAAWHLGLGMSRFAARWWPHASPPLRRAATGAGFALATVLGLGGMAALTAFARTAP